MSEHHTIHTVRATPIDGHGQPTGPARTMPVDSAVTLPIEEPATTDSRAARRAQRKALDVLRDANATTMLSKRNRQQLGDVAGEMRQAMHGSKRYTPPARRHQSR